MSDDARLENGPETLEVAEQQPNRCLDFWGTWHFGLHSLREAGGSKLLPKPVFLMWRIAAFGYLLGILITAGIRGSSFKALTLWSLVGLTFAFLLMIIASFRHTLQKTFYEDEPRIFAGWVVCIFQIFASAALFIDVAYWALLYEPGQGVEIVNVSIHGVNLGLVLIDMFIGLNMQFRLCFWLCSIFYLLFYLLFMWINQLIHKEWVYDIFDYERNGAGRVVAYHVGIIAWGIIAPFIMLLLSRVNRLVKMENRRSTTRSPRAEEEATSPEEEATSPEKEAASPV